MASFPLLTRGASCPPSSSHAPAFPLNFKVRVLIVAGGGSPGTVRLAPSGGRCRRRPSPGPGVPRGGGTGAVPPHHPLRPKSARALGCIGHLSSTATFSSGEQDVPEIRADQGKAPSSLPPPFRPSVSSLYWCANRSI